MVLITSMVISWIAFLMFPALHIVAFHIGGFAITWGLILFFGLLHFFNKSGK